MQKSLDAKLESIHSDPANSNEFIIADAKDADMGFGIAAPGRRHSSNNRDGDKDRGKFPFKSLEEYREQIRQVIRQGVVDIVLMSASTSEILCQKERLFDNSHVTPAIRANDATDIFVFRGSTIPNEPAQPFRTALLDHAQCGEVDCPLDNREFGADLGLYSVTFNNLIDEDLNTLNTYREFRIEAERKKFRHFLEVFHPNFPGTIPTSEIPFFVNDVIARTLAGVPSVARPIFLKIPYPGPEALEELVNYDPHLVVGILGGSSGTTRDAFQMIHDAQKYGARVALYGRKINHSENQLAFIEFLRHIVDGVISPEEAVVAYHSVLEKLGTAPHRPLELDQQITTGSQSYNEEAVSSSSTSPTPNKPSDVPTSIDFSKMTSEERLDYHRNRLKHL
ncbi:fructose-bisphosphate aldolase [Thalassoglobus neptunius]|uniref:Fructose-bisphosphate aldolase n=1 Tax=Thalassoglobus neptunius TaxID=1938619 RepID=A0A5C5VMK7_9PLAN|nr:hypothetical protein [Thalassoglobus neptunius]TWT39896.1 fructose-bisphosphate aldolase [Thalassoglobus neptunius]